MAYNPREPPRRRAAPSRHNGLAHWIPLALTVTVATIGLAAWVWKERRDEEEQRKNDGPPPGNYGPGGPPAPYGPPPPGGPPFQPGPPGPYPSQGQGPLPPGQQGPYPPNQQAAYPPGQQGAYPPSDPPQYREGQPPYPPGTQVPPADDGSVVARVAGALRRTPSPQQLLDGASRRVVAGVAAAGTMIGGALGAIREEDKKDFEDHSRWSEEAVAQQGVGETASGGSNARKGPSGRKSGDRRKTVAIVISADTGHAGTAEEEVTYHQEHAVRHPSHSVDGIGLLT